MLSFAAVAVVAAVSVTTVCAQLGSCPDTSAAEYDYVVVGAGAGGGPVAARLAESGFSGESVVVIGAATRADVYTVLVVDVGHDVNNFNTTIPAYVGRVIEGTFGVRFLSAPCS